MSVVHQVPEKQEKHWRSTKCRSVAGFCCPRGTSSDIRSSIGSWSPPLTSSGYLPTSRDKMRYQPGNHLSSRSISSILSKKKWLPANINRNTLLAVLRDWTAMQSNGCPFVVRMGVKTWFATNYVDNVGLILAKDLELRSSGEMIMLGMKLA